MRFDILNASAQVAVTAANGSLAYAAASATGATYAVTIAAQPTDSVQICIVANGVGTAGSAGVTSVTAYGDHGIFESGFNG